ncbi:uncharacterized protein LOC144677484 [Cetorhinus maximus]
MALEFISINLCSLQTLSFQGRLKFLHGQNKKAKDGAPIPPQLALFAVATPLQPPSILEVRTKTLIFQTKHKLDFTPLACDTKGKFVLGYTEMELCMRGTGYQFIHAADMMYCADNHVRMIKTGESGMTVFRLLTKQNSWVWVQANARLVYKGGRPDSIISKQRPLTNEEGEEHLRKRSMQLPFNFATGEAVLYDTNALLLGHLDSFRDKGTGGKKVPTGANGTDRKNGINPSSILGAMMTQNPSVYALHGESKFSIDDVFANDFAVLNVPGDFWQQANGGKNSSEQGEMNLGQDDPLSTIMDILSQKSTDENDLCDTLGSLDVDVENKELEQWEETLMKMDSTAIPDDFNDILTSDFILSYVEDMLTKESSKANPFPQDSIDPMQVKLMGTSQQNPFGFDTQNSAMPGCQNSVPLGYQDSMVPNPQTPMITCPQTPMMPGPQTPMMPGPQTPMMPGPQTPMVPNPQTPMMPGPQTPMMPGPQTPMMPGPQTPMMPGPQTPMMPGPQTPVMPGPQTPMMPGPQTPMMPGPQTPMMPGPQTPMMPGPQTPMMPGPQTPMMPGPQTPMMPGPQTPMMPGPQTPMMPGPQTPMMPSPQSPMVSAAQNPLLLAPQHPAVSGSQDAMPFGLQNSSMNEMQPGVQNPLGSSLQNPLGMSVCSPPSLQSFISHSPQKQIACTPQRMSCAEQVNMEKVPALRSLKRNLQQSTLQRPRYSELTGQLKVQPLNSPQQPMAQWPLQMPNGQPDPGQPYQAYRAPESSCRLAQASQGRVSTACYLDQGSSDQLPYSCSVAAQQRTSVSQFLMGLPPGTASSCMFASCQYQGHGEPLVRTGLSFVDSSPLTPPPPYSKLKVSPNHSPLQATCYYEKDPVSSVIGSSAVPIGELNTYNTSCQFEPNFSPLPITENSACQIPTSQAPWN